MDTEHYKGQGYKFVAAEDPKEYEYVKHVVAFKYEKMTRTFNTDFMKCKAKKDDSPVTFIGVSRSYAEGGDVYTSIIDEKAETQYIDAEVVKVSVLYNRKYAGEHTSEGVLEVLDIIRGK